MAESAEYKSVYREIRPGDDYVDAGAFLAEFASDGWRLVCTAWAGGVLKDADYEIFYLERTDTGAPD